MPPPSIANNQFIRGPQAARKERPRRGRAVPKLRALPRLAISLILLSLHAHHVREALSQGIVIKAPHDPGMNPCHPQAPFPKGCAANETCVLRGLGVADCVVTASYCGPLAAPVFTDVTKQSSCQCVANAYGADWRACSACGANRQSPVGSVAPTACVANAGYTGPDGTTAATACVNDSYKAAMGSAACSPCGPDRQAPSASTNVTACVANAGYTGIDGASTATACSVHTYKAVTGSASCLPCGANRQSPPASASATACVANAGYTGADGTSIATACPSDTYKNVTGPGPCVACPSGSNSPPASNSSAACVINPAQFSSGDRRGLISVSLVGVWVSTLGASTLVDGSYSYGNGAFVDESLDLNTGIVFTFPVPVRIKQVRARTEHSDPKAWKWFASNDGVTLVAAQASSFTWSGTDNYQNLNDIGAFTRYHLVSQATNHDAPWVFEMEFPQFW